MHGCRKGHDVTTAKLAIDEAVNNEKDKGKKVAILSTDLTAAFDTVNHALLLNKLEHIGVRVTGLKLLTSFVTDRHFYTEVQGFNSQMMKLPPMSVCQGTKLSGMLYQIFTIDNAKINAIMKDQKVY